MSNETLKKTSDEEGKYAEYLFRYICECLKVDYTDVSDDEYYQKIDVDALYCGRRIEIKNDTIIHTSKNAVYEIKTHVSKEDIEAFNRLKENQYEIALSDIPNVGSVGCNEKCGADTIFYVSVVEDKNNPKHYRLFYKDPIFLIDNNKWREYMHHNKLLSSRFRSIYHPEDDVYNICYLFNIFDMIRLGFARSAHPDTLEIIDKAKPQLSEYRTSDELKKILLND